MDTAINNIEVGISDLGRSLMSIELSELIGKRFGMVVVTAWSHRDEYYNNYFHCRCDCGAELVKRASQFRYGKFHTCGAEVCRFWEKVNKNGPVVSEELGPCHVWTGATHTGDYGVFKAAGSKKVLRAHVYAWSLVNGPVPAGLVVRHKCDTPLCVRESHLHLGTHQENVQDMVDRGRSHASRAKVPEDVRASIRLEYSTGSISQKALSLKHEVTVKTIQRILRETS